MNDVFVSKYISRPRPEVILTKEQKERAAKLWFEHIQRTKNGNTVSRIR